VVEEKSERKGGREREGGSEQANEQEKERTRERERERMSTCWRRRKWRVQGLGFPLCIPSIERWGAGVEYHFQEI